LSLSRYDNGHPDKNDGAFYNKLVTETLRRYPPVHNTRRIAVKDIGLGGETIKAGEMVLIVLAAANLDDRVFTGPEKFDLRRDNNDANLTFGLGGHNCIAKYLSIGMAADACRFLVNNYRNINILQKEFTHEPQLNVRLLKQLGISLW
jgi:cytochrome P450